MQSITETINTILPIDILLVEDDVAQSELLTRWMEESGPFRVSVASNARLANELMGTRPWSLLIADVGLPDEDGFAVMRQARASRPELPVVIITGSDEHSLAQQALQHQADDFLRKPIAYAAFLSCVKTQVLERVVPQVPIAPHLDASDPLGAWFYEAVTRGMSHEINNKLTVAIASAELMLIELNRDIHDQKRLKSYCNLLAQGIEQTLHLSDTMRGMGQMGSLTPERVALANLVQRTTWLLQYLADEACVSLTMTYPKSEAWVIGVPAQLYQVIVLLTLDAIEAMSGWTVKRLAIRICNEEGTAGIDVACMGMAGVVVPAPHNQATAAATHGTRSLPMKFCKSIIASHKGTIETESAPLKYSMLARIPIADSTAR